MDDDGPVYSGSTQAIFHNDGEDEGHLTGALKVLYGGENEYQGRSKFAPPRPVRGPLGGSREELVKEELKTRDNPVVGETVIEVDVLAGRFWDFNLTTQTPVLKDPQSQTQPPWGSVDIKAMVKTNVPVTLVGAAQLYFNAAKYSQERFYGLLAMMDIQNLPKDQFVYFTENSSDPLKDGYVTMWRFVSKVAYDSYYRNNMAFDQNPAKKRARISLFDTFDKCVKGEKKKWGSGKPMIKLKFPVADGEEEEEEEPVEEEEDEDGGGAEGHERLNELMGMQSYGRNAGEWGLGFGFLVESDVYRVYRIWSRPIYHSLPPKAAKADRPTEW